MLTRPLPAWIKVTNFLWLVGGLFAALACLYLVVVRPTVTKTWNADNLTNAVEEKNDYRLYQTETDVGGQRFVWTHAQKALLIIPVTSHNQQPIKITIRARGASAAGGPTHPTQVSANGKPLGIINPIAGEAKFQDFVFNFVPAYNDSQRILLNFDTPAWKPTGDPRVLGLAFQSMSVDLSEVWSPIVRPGRQELIFLLPLLIGLLVLSLIAKFFVPEPLKKITWSVSIGLSLLIVGFSLLWLFLLTRVGFNGALNETLFWLYLACLLYLIGFFGWLGYTLLNVQFVGQFVQKRPILSAFAVIFLFNLGISGLFVGKIILETGSIATIFRYLDGPEYVVIGNNFYDLNEPLLVIPDFKQHSPFYWGAHFPGFSVALMLAKPLIGWIWSPLLVNFLVSTLFAFVFYLLLRDFGYARHPLWVSLAALVLPIRWLIYHNVGSSEPLFMLFQILAIYLFKKERYWWAGLVGFGAVFTRPPGMFLWAGFMAWLAFEAAVKTWNAPGFNIGQLLRNFNWRAFVPLLLMPLGLVAVFGIYLWRYGDFWAYFKITENVTHIGLVPFPTLLTGVFESPALIYTYILEIVGLYLLWQQKRYDIFWIGLASFVYSLFLLHSDVLRYSIPFFALIVLLPFADFVSHKVARWIAAPVLLAILFYSWGAFYRNLSGLDTYEAMLRILGIS